MTEKAADSSHSVHHSQCLRAKYHFTRHSAPSIQSSSLGNLMDDESYLNSIRGGLKESVDFFATPNATAPHLYSTGRLRSPAAGS